MTIIEYSIETLYHFKCTQCQRWWSIGDWKKVNTLICPHCGQQGQVFALKTKEFKNN